MPETAARTIAFAAKMIRSRADEPSVRQRGDREWMLELATWLDSFDEPDGGDVVHGPDWYGARDIARAYIGVAADA